LNQDLQEWVNSPTPKSELLMPEMNTKSTGKLLKKEAGAKMKN